MSLEKFTEAFNNLYQDNEWVESEYDRMHKFIDDSQAGIIALNGELVSEDDDVRHDSYGNENSSLRRIFYFEDYNMLVLFYGTRSSYNGTDWDGFREVKETTQVIKKWE